MTTPEEARDFAKFISDMAWSEPGPLCNYRFDGAAEAFRDLANQVEQLEAQRKELREALISIKHRSYNEEPCEELEDAQRDLRNIYAFSSAALKATE